jgi:hypothetical protein
MCAAPPQAALFVICKVLLAAHTYRGDFETQEKPASSSGESQNQRSP